ncbi:copper resistance protein CopZ [Prevotella intermedia]|uniref:Copper resistance protein CopZ n=1 Tax=Prevotella intermedia TaxID=28131 RepID=A0A2M8TMJ5_PREIN|nr:heavy-metal-associated domain-containing protein [Prevotella intermedia]PJI25134.1 copper resistance protein CopZ [Prevotella intermedia]
MENKVFTVNGMKCEHCKANVENAIKGVVGVEMAEVNLVEKTVEVAYDENLVKPELLKNAVEASGRFEMML